MTRIMARISCDKCQRALVDNEGRLKCELRANAAGAQCFPNCETAVTYGDSDVVTLDDLRKFFEGEVDDIIADHQIEGGVGGVVAVTVTRRSDCVLTRSQVREQLNTMLHDRLLSTLELDFRVV